LPCREHGHDCTCPVRGDTDLTPKQTDLSAQLSSLMATAYDLPIGTDEFR
jgi:hypothetical protein